MKNFISLMCVLWIVTSIAKLPVFLGLIISYIIFIRFFRFGNEEMYSIKKILLSVLIASALLTYFLVCNVYPPNISVLVSGGIGFIVLDGNLLRGFRSGVLDFLFRFAKKERVLTLSFLAVWVTIFLAGSFYSLKVGLSWDELVEQHTFNLVLETISNGLKGDPKYLLINSYTDKYYGVGFYFPFYFMHRFFAAPISGWLDVSIENAILLSRHMAVFWLFAISSLYVAGIIYLLTKSKKYALLVAISYLVWPYALGHGLTNVKDSPFASVWVISTYYMLRIFSDYLDRRKISKFNFAALTFSICWLLSIRIGGVLILIPILVAFIFFMSHYFYGNYLASNSKKNAILANFKLLQSHANSILLYLGIIVVVTLLSYPAFWQDPSEIFRAVKYMSHHPWNLCTLTNGDCMPGQNVPPSYIPLWLIVKEPVVAILGFLVTPIIFGKLIFKKDYRAIILLAILFFSIIIIYLLLVFRKVVLYDEIRHVLFMSELIFIVGTAAIFIFSAKAGFIAIILSIVLFSFDNIKIYPYQLSWFNEVSRFREINNKYETDYWGNVLSRLAIYVNNNQHIYKDIKCIYATPYHLFSPYLNNQKYKCSGNADNIFNKDTPRPFLFARTARERSTLPDSCYYVYRETITLPLTKQPIYLGELILCN